jgi:hypothetical protein
MKDTAMEAWESIKTIRIGERTEVAARV